ncbi:acyltransferase 3 [Mycena metata]|uniref:Acyltransferase 3 n=1 Tax=Mycena metata TaxID=1033252 RepID=A0AAD7J772_9AGAR|nr:acyltransferase 3 [Mycena metata]
MSSDPQGELAAFLPHLKRDSRIHYIDNLRSSLLALVIFHHAALPFGGIGFWLYISPYHPAWSSPLLSLFVVVNQSYFMGMLFFLSGHFSAISASRKNWRAFCLDKLKRLGIPAVVYTLLVQPVAIILVRWAQHASIWAGLKGYYSGINGVRGPAWFIAVLLVFDLVYIFIRKTFSPSSFLIPSSLPRYRWAVARCIFIIIVTSFLIRLSYPVGRNLPPLGLQLAYAAQYVLAYTAGTCLSYIQQYLLVPHPARALALAYLFAIISLAGIAIPFRLTPSIAGGANLAALLYVIWNEVFFYFIGSALYSVFQLYTMKRWGNTARYSYGAFLIHSVVIVALQILVDAGSASIIHLHSVVKTVFVGFFGVILSWAVAWILIRIPAVGKII